MSTSILVLWWFALVAAIVLVLPIAYYLLERTFRAARHIRDYTAEILTAAEGIERNLIRAVELERLPGACAQARKAAADLAIQAGDLERFLRRD